MATQPLIPRPRGGRRGPRTTRERKYFLPLLDRQLLDQLAAWAERFDVPVGPVVENLVGRAHGYVSPWAPKLDLASVGVDVERLQVDADAIRSQDVGLPEGGNRIEYGFRLDEPLAFQVMCRCDELDVSYGQYLRQVLLLATGLLEERPIQLRLVDEGTSP